MLPVVSVICTTYNHELYIKQALDGFVMQQCNFPVEIIIHDDASTDNTVAIIKEYAAKHPFFKTILQTENQYSKGFPIWNYLFTEVAQGKYIAICEGDDYWTDPLKLQKQVDFMETHEDVSLCFHDSDVLYENENRKEDIFENLEEREYSVNEILKKWTVPTASVLCRTKFVKKSKWDNRFEWGDITLFLFLGHCGKIYCIKDKMSVYRRLNTGMMFSYRRSITSLVRILGHYEAVKEHYPKVDEKIINGFIVRCCVSLFYWYLSKISLKSFSIAYKGMRLDPMLFIKAFFQNIPLIIFKRGRLVKSRK